MQQISSRSNHNQENQSKSGADVDLQLLEEEFAFMLDKDRRGELRDAQIIELIGTVSEITNVLNFDLRHLELKDTQIEELKGRLTEGDRMKDSELNEFKRNISEEVKGVKDEYENKFRMAQEGKRRHEEENKQLVSANLSLQSQVDAAQKLFEEKSGEIKKICESQKNFKDAIQALEMQVKAQNQALCSKETHIDFQIVQRKVCMRQMRFDEINYNNTLKAIGYLEKKYQPASS